MLTALISILFNFILDKLYQLEGHKNFIFRVRNLDGTDRWTDGQTRDLYNKLSKARLPADCPVFELASMSVTATDVNVHRNFVALFAVIHSEVATVPVWLFLYKHAHTSLF